MQQLYVHRGIVGGHGSKRKRNCRMAAHFAVSDVATANDYRQSASRAAIRS